ncbi:hypothetical protein NEUTE2DRAFT_58343 [Neurospora tetrasperma FGSC 2509]|nr:hypothetical protein NEUTE2DRAFT_58343 [Neurospora tetrasperma FGSC 2509]
MSSSPGAAVRLVPAWCGLDAVLVQSGAEALQQRCEADRWDWTRPIARKHGDGTARHSQATRKGSRLHTTNSRALLARHTTYDTITPRDPGFGRIPARLGDPSRPRLHQLTPNPRSRTDSTIQIRDTALAPQGYLTTGKNGTDPTAARPVGEILSSVPELDSTERSSRS